MYAQRPQREIPHLKKCPHKESVGTAQNQMPLHVVGRSLPHELLIKYISLVGNLSIEFSLLHIGNICRNDVTCS